MAAISVTILDRRILYMYIQTVVEGLADTTDHPSGKGDIVITAPALPT